jgi:hypothetical protein
MNKIMLRSLVPAVVLALALTSGVSAANFAIDRYVIGGGGGGYSSASFALVGTVGQTVVGYSSSATFGLDSGFWVPEGPIGPPPVEIAILDQAKLLGNGQGVHVTGKVAVTDFSDFASFFYIEEVDRSSGIRVVASSVNGTLAKGATVEVTGTMATTSAGERYIGSASVTVTGTHLPITPLGVTNKTLGGSALGTPPAGQYGVAGGSGTNNIGLLVKVWGQVTGSGAGFVTVDDGSGVSVRVDTSGAPSVPTTGYAVVKGVSSLYGTTGSATRLVLAID